MKNRIKNYDIEKKAQRNYYEHIEDFFEGEMFSSTLSRPRTPSSLKARMLAQSRTGEKFNVPGEGNNPMYKTTNSFFKGSTRKSTSMTNEND